MRIVFMGTPEFAVPTLNRIAGSVDHAVVAVYTRPDRPAGRALRLRPSPVKEAALRLGLRIEQPERLRGPAAEDMVLDLTSHGAEAIVVVAYGLIIPQRIFDAPPYGTVNLHPSLLPRHRGAAPIERAILAGDARTGVTTMRIDAGIDTGAILEQQDVPILPHETSGELRTRLAELGAELVMSTLAALGAGHLVARPQTSGEETYAEKVGKADCALDFSGSAEQVARIVRALSPEPGACCLLVRGAGAGTAPAASARPLRVKLLRATAGAPVPPAGAALPGTIVRADSKGSDLVVACGDGRTVVVTALQPEGKRPQDGGSFVRGYRVGRGDQFVSLASEASHA
ncbi:MAG: methionyl-tRNA formyltransferase [Candidatus Schekmanbacteria bacterium]|nr:methionyl-tRNA formyltransferase [Candidatus Schekmanbacteria bacterium]